MKLIVSTALVCATAVLCVWMVLRETRPEFIPPALATIEPRAPAPATNSYEFHAVDNHIFIIDQSNGWIWRYFINRDDKGKITNEGFAQLGFLPMADRVPVATASPSPTVAATP